MEALHAQCEKEVGRRLAIQFGSTASLTQRIETARRSTPRSSRSKQADAGKALISFLAGPRVTALLKAKGIDRLR